MVEKIARMLRLGIETPKLIQLLGELFNPTKPFLLEMVKLRSSYVPFCQKLYHP